MAADRDTKNSKNRRGTALSANLPMEMAQAVYQQVRNGTYDSAGAVVRAALRHLLKLDEDGLPLPPEGAAGDGAQDDDGAEDERPRRGSRR